MKPARLGGIGAALEVVELCAQRHVPMWIGEAVKQVWLYGEGRGGPDQDSSELIKHIEAWSNVTVTGK